MTAPALATDRPAIRFRGTTYPVLLPTVRDPRLQLAAVIVTLQVLGQTVFDFRLSIAQILISLVTCAVLEVGIALHRQHVLMWPASALLTGNGVAFILRVPGTEHGDWWSTNGWWIFAGTAAVSLLSKYVITFRGRHIFNPSNFGLVLCFVLLGPEHADPLAFWWGPMSVWLALALALIVGGGLKILSRLKLVGIAAGFWLTFAAGVAVLAAAGHQMTAPWHLGPIAGFDLWWLLVTSPEILVFLFFMITDPRTIPETARGRRIYAISVGLVACLLIAPWTTEFAAKLAVLGALTIVCVARPPLLLLGAGVGSTRSRSACARHPGLPSSGRESWRPRRGGRARRGGDSRRARPRRSPRRSSTGRVPQVTVERSEGLATMDEATARRIAASLVADLSRSADALRERDRAKAREGATGAWLADLWQRIDAARGATIEVPDVRRGACPSEPRARNRPGPARRRRHADGHDAGGDVRPCGRDAGAAGAARAGGAHVRACLDRRPLPRLGDSRRPGGRADGDDGAGVVPTEGRRRERGPRLPPGLLPLRDGQRRRHRDDGWRALLARLRRRRLARPLRRELVLAGGRRPLERGRWPPAEPSVPQRARPLRGRHREDPHRVDAAGKRLRRCRLRRERHDRPPRDGRRVRPAAQRVRRPAVEQRRRNVHRGREGRRDRPIRAGTPARRRRM